MFYIGIFHFPFCRQFYSYCCIVSTISFKFMQGEKYMRFNNTILFIPFTLLSFIGDYYSSLHLLVVCFCTFVSCIEFLSSNSSPFPQIEFLMQGHFLLSNCEIIVRFILFISFSFNLDRYFPCCRKARSHHLGFLFHSCISD